MGRRLRAAVVIVATAAVLAGCSGSGQDSDSMTAANPADAGGSDAGGSEAAAAPDADPAAAPAPGAETRTIRTGDVSVRVKNLSAAATAARGAATGLGGFVASESTGVDGEADGEEGGTATLVLRVPEAKTEQLIDAVVRTGVLMSRSTNAEDVTAAIADVDSRVASQTRSLQRVRALLDRAASINDVVMLESELSKRETELEAMQARQRSLNDRATMSTITANLSLPGAADEADLGFLAGLDAGWNAFAAALVLGATVLGALLPFLLPLALLALLAWTARRRLRRPRPSTP